MTRNYAIETEKRVAYIREKLAECHASGIVFGNSGGKDSALVGILCKMACDDTVGVRMPCQSKRNFGVDFKDGGDVAEKFGIETRDVDITPVKEALLKALDGVTTVNNSADININPRLRMTAVYAIAAAENRLVAGTGNKDEIYMGYFTKWGDGGYDLNPIADLCVGEVYEFLRYLGAPDSVIEKAPSAGLYEGQTDEADMGVTYAEIDAYLRGEEVSAEAKAVIERYHSRSEHKRRMASVYPG